MTAIKIISVILGMLFGTSILSGSSISPHVWYAAPFEYSLILVSAIVPISLMFIINNLLTFVFKKVKKNRVSYGDF
jgi:magnesium-transporting ATPase (P-type)